MQRRRFKEGGQYEIRFQAHLDARWDGGFDGLNSEREADGTTTLTGRVIDQAALHGLLRKLRDLGVVLISVRRVESDPQRSKPEPRTRH